VKGAGGILRVFLPEPEKASVSKKIKFFFPKSLPDEASLAEETGVFEKYFSRCIPDFAFELDFSGSTWFQRTVWSVAAEIPYGQTRTYGWIAERIKKPNAARAVGNALGLNPFPIIIPCHRVIRQNRGLGGFSAPMGTRLKEKLLRLEGAGTEFGI
jgi:methylated-DNA-[protein]-cysteine S-methyltransferase